MKNETRIATWREPASLSRPSLTREFAGASRPVKRILFVAIAFPIFRALQGLISTPEALLNACLFVTLPACTLALFGSWAYRRYCGVIDPLPVYEHGDALPRMNVVIRLSADGHIYGEDRGELTLVDDWLVFEGERTSFSLAPHDVAHLVSGVKESDRLPVGLRIRAAGAVQLWIIAEDSRRDPRDFLESWTTQTVPGPAISILPPLVPMPGATSLLAWCRSTLRSVPNWGWVMLGGVIYGFAGAARGVVGWDKFSLSSFLAIQIGGAVACVLAFLAFRWFVRGRVLARLAVTSAVLSTSPLGRGLPPIPPLRAMREEAETRSVRQ